MREHFLKAIVNPLLLSYTRDKQTGGTCFSEFSRFSLSMPWILSTEENVSEAWIGLHDHSSEGRYIWVDGSTIPFSEWLPGEPDGNEDENCIVQARGEHSPGWGDRHCFDAKAFVCKVPLPGRDFKQSSPQRRKPLAFW